MAEKVALLESYLSCHVCSETYRDPVSLGCHHSFCSSCLQKFWEQAKNKNCPICKRKSSKDNLVVDFKLQDLADSFSGRKKTETQKEPKLFGGVVPIEKAVSDLKELLKSLQDKRDKCNEVEKTYNKVIKHSKKQVVSTERQIKAEFNKLHQFLKEEEESRLAALREEEKQKGKTVLKEMKIIEEQISSLSDSISAVEAELQKQTVPFLSSYKTTQTRARELSSEPDPQLVPEALIDVAKHLGNLAFRVWEKIKEKVHFSPVILDPNTANPWLYLSDDLTSVRRGDTMQPLPDNPERHMKYPSVLGSEGFSSGKHSWDVEVGDHPDWAIGLAKESVDRKGKRFASPEDGIWCLKHADGRYTNGLKTVTVKKGLQRIRVQLDYDMGEVSFYDHKDMSLIYTHRDTFTEKLFPYFCVGEAGDAKTADIKIC